MAFGYKASERCQLLSTCFTVCDLCQSISITYALLCYHVNRFLPVASLTNDFNRFNSLALHRYHFNRCLLVIG